MSASQPASKFEVRGTVTKVAIRDRSKRAGVPNLYTYVTLTVEQTMPSEVADQLRRDALSFIRPTDEQTDRQIAVGDTLVVTVLAYDLSKPDYFTVQRWSRAC